MGLEDGFPPEFLFLTGGEISGAQRVDDAGALDDAVGANHLGDGNHRGYLANRDTRFFQLGRDRSAAASAGPSSRGEDHRVNPRILQLLRDLLSQTAAVG